MITLRRSKFVAVLWTIVILVGLSLPGQAVPDLHIVYYDKILHFTIFGILAWVWMGALQGSVASRAVRVFVFGLSYGIFTELYQAFILPYERSAEVWDVAADAAGLLVALLLYYLLTRKKTQPV